MNHLPDSFKESVTHGTQLFSGALYADTNRESDFLVKAHWHEELEIIHFAEGVFRVEVNMQPFSITSESFMFLHTGELHKITAAPPYKEAALVYAPAIISFEEYDMVQHALMQPLLNHTFEFPRLITADDPLFAQIKTEFAAVERLLPAEEPLHLAYTPATVFGQLTIKAALLKIMAILLGGGRLNSVQKKEDARITLLKQALLFIKEHYQEKIYIAELAALLNLNEQYFCRFFKKAMGRTVIEYINEYRVRHAIALLENSDLNVTAICFESGFGHLGHFMKEFRKYTKTTPLQYKKQL
ncbi:MAG: helix-turn-helix transcriptional regulator [Lachnospiraceae bacterium]